MAENEKGWKVEAEDYKVFPDGSLMHSKICSRPLTEEEKEINSKQEKEREEGIRKFREKQELIESLMPKTENDKISFLRSKYSEIPCCPFFFNPDYEHPCKDCYEYRRGFDFGYIDWSDTNIQIIGSQSHICGFNGPHETLNKCAFFYLRNLKEFENYWMDYLDWTRNSIGGGIERNV